MAGSNSDHIDIGYIYGYYNELNPLRHRLAFLNQGLLLPELNTACELGFGQGININIHAAATQTEWWGTDFDPAQVFFAQELANASEANLLLFEQAFEEFCQRSDLPDFDYIALHGIWSWISDKNRAVIVDFIRQRLRAGGVLYISYNTQPGWAARAPMRHLLAEYAEVMAAPGAGAIESIKAAIDFTDRLFATKPAYTRDNPLVLAYFENLKRHDPHYAVHEYFCQNWQPMPIADVARWLEPAKLSYACSAYYPNHVDDAFLTSEQQQFLHAIPNPLFKQTVRDYMTNQQFRHDCWVKGARKITVIEQQELLRKQRVMLTVPPDQVSVKLIGALNSFTISPDVYIPILDALADYQPKTLGQIETAVKAEQLEFEQILQTVLVLIGNGSLHPAQDANSISQAKIHTDKLNHHLLHKARVSNDIKYLASPVTGGGIAVSQLNQLFLLARLQGKKQPREWATFVWHILSAQAALMATQEIVQASANENIAALTDQANVFSSVELPILKALGIA